MCTITAYRCVCLAVILSLVGVVDGHGTKPSGETITTIFTREGDNVTLSCHLGSFSAFDLKKDSQNVFFYPGTGQDYTNGLAGQDHQFKGRVSLAPGGLQARNASVIISNVTRKDSGEYKCIILPTMLTSWIQVIVVLDPQLKLTIEEAPLSSGWARLSCVSTGGLPQPRAMVWKNQDGAELPAGPTTNSTDSSGRYRLQLDLNVTEPGNYTCLALQGDVNPARDTIQLFGNWQSSPKRFPCLKENVISALIFGVCILIFFTYHSIKDKLCGIYLSIKGGGHTPVKTEDIDLKVKV